MLNQVIRHALADEQLTAYRPGDRLRDHLFVEDAAWAFCSAAIHVDRLSPAPFIISSGEGTTLLQAMRFVAEHATHATGRAVSVVEIDPPTPQSPIEARHFVGDSRRFSTITGWRPRFTLPVGIEGTTRAFLVAGATESQRPH